MFWVVLGLYIFFGIIWMITMALVPPEAGQGSPSLSGAMAIRIVVSFLFSIIFFYFSINSYYRQLLEKRKPFSFLQLSLLLLVVCFSYHFAYYKLFPTKEQQEYATFPLMVFGIILKTIFFIGVSLLIAYLTNLRDEQKQRKILEAQKMQLEMEKSQANFNFLKSQINPHFLHNTLNFLYAKSLPYSPELSEGILTLSDIMRYALSEGNAKDGKAPLKDEIEHVRNVIKINQLRFSNNLKVEFEVQGVVNGAMIIPFVLITIVENAFKHGDLKSSENPIVIRAEIQGAHFYFYCRNKKKSGPKEISTGIGLDNIKKRLDLAYGNNYSIHIKDEAEFYTTELTIHPL